MMNCEGMTHSSWVQQLNGDDKPDIRVELDSTWRDEVGTLHKTVKTPFEIYGDGDYTEIKEAGVILANSLAFDEGAQDIMDRNKHAWHLASESFLNTRAGEKLIGECGGCTFDDTATQGAGRSIILHFPSLCDTNLSDPDLSNKGLYRKFHRRWAEQLRSRLSISTIVQSIWGSVKAHVGQYHILEQMNLGSLVLQVIVVHM